MSLCKACVSGVKHEGQPEGTFKTIGGVECYVGVAPSPSTTNNSSQDDPVKILLLLPDALGNHLNTQLLVDAFARNGFYTISPDYLNGDPFPTAIMTASPEEKVQMIADWVPRHSQQVTRPTLDKVINALKQEVHANQNVRFAATGYCFGGRYVFDLAIDNITSVSIASHPSLLEIKDIHSYANTKPTPPPLLLNTCEIDSQFGHEKQMAADDVLGNVNTAGFHYKREYWPGCEHGFAVRGDMNDPHVKAGIEGSFKATIDWLNKYF